jgi:hypothetical protein
MSSDSRPGRSAVFLDATHSKALLDAALTAGIVSFKSTDGFDGLLLDSRSSKRYHRAALEMAVLFEKVHLHGTPADLDLSRLKKEGVVGLNVTVGQTLDIDNFAAIPPDFIRDVKPALVRHVHRKQNTVRRRIGLDEIPYRVISRAFDALATAAESEIDFADFKHNIGRVFMDPKVLTTDDTIDRELVIDVLSDVWNQEGTKGALPPAIDVACMPLLNALTELLDFWTPLVFSLGLSLPLLTRFTAGSFADHLASTDTAKAAFRLCRLSMQDKLSYAPVVETFEDVLRLREHKGMDRFRTLLHRWCEVLAQGEEQAIREIGQDIEKANKELRRLERWRKIDSWLFWVQLPALLIPVLSSMVTVASFSTGLWMRRIEEKHSWVTIGR